MGTNLNREEFENKATAYALGSINLHEARAFEELFFSFDENEIKELEELGTTVTALAYNTPSAVPSPSVKEKLFANINEETNNNAPKSTQTPPMFKIRADEGEWLDYEPGIKVKPLFVDPSTKTMTTLMKMSPASALPRHRHIGVEQCYVIEGEMIVGDVRYTTGDFFCAMPDTIHECVRSDIGGLILIVSPDHYEVV